MKFNSIIFFSFLSLLSLFGAACKSSARAKGEVKVKKKSEKFLYKKVLDSTVDFDWLSLKARVGYKDDYQGIRASANIRLRKDSVIWMNVKKFNIEAARLLITPDSVFLLDRINRQFVRTDFSYLEKLFHFPRVYSSESKQLESMASFESLQELLLGNFLLVPAEENIKVEIEIPYHKVTGDVDNDLKTAYWLDGQTFAISRMKYDDRINVQTLDIQLDDYQLIDGSQKFSYFRNIRMNSPENGNIELEVKITSAEFNVPKSIIFEIPSRYKEIE